MTPEENRRTLLRDVKQLIVDALQLDDVQPDSIADDEPLVGSGLSLDSIDALELAMAITGRYSVKMSQGDETRDAFRSVGHLVDYILLQRA